MGALGRREAAVRRVGATASSGQYAFFKRVFRHAVIGPAVANKSLYDANLGPPATGEVWTKVSGGLLPHRLLKVAAMNGEQKCAAPAERAAVGAAVEPQPAETVQGGSHFSNAFFDMSL